MISASDRKNAIKLIDEAKRAGARESIACKELGISHRTLQRWRNPSTPLEDQRPVVERPEPRNKLSKDEEAQILKTVNQPEFQSLPPSQIVPILAERGEYVASESTMYRVMRKHKLQNHRGRSKERSARPLSTHCATGPNQVWMWDISWLQGPVKGVYFYMYFIMDLYSRKIIGWEVWPEESTENASALVRRATMSEQCALRKDPLILHSDNGSPMKGMALQETLHMLGIIPSRSRPRVSNDNPYAESLFGTCKYRPGYPSGGFASLTAARVWVLDFVNWYNNEHRHSGLNFVTPNQRHTGLAAQIFEKRQQTYEAARAAHPKRWSSGTRNWSLEDEVWLNPERIETASHENRKVV